MNGWIRQSQAARGVFALLIFCALAIRLTIPTGFMPTQSIHGIVISLCTGEGAVKAILRVEKDSEPADHDADRDRAKGGACSFAAGLGSGLLTPASAVRVATPPLFAPLIAGRAIADLTVHRLAAPPPPAQAPPARA